MAYTVVDKGSKYFNTVLYTGTTATQSITGVGFKPDWVWLKSRGEAQDHYLFDINRTATKALSSDLTLEEQTYTDSLTSFDSDGFTLGASTRVNKSPFTHVSWNWLGANTTVSNTSGSITSTVSANTTSGFSIVGYTGDGVNNRTIGHGLGATPKFIIIKNRSAGTAYWSVINPRSTSTSDTNILYLNRTDAEADDTNIMGSNLPNSTTFGIGNYNGVNVNAQNFIAYCFAEVKGYSKFGSYTGNGSTDGTFIYTGFKPAFVLTKSSSNTSPWLIYDNKRLGYNAGNNYFYANSTNAEASDAPFDILSNGFKFRNTFTDGNGSGYTYIYMAFAENPFVTSGGIPVTAR
jgi:hypothetical protein